MNAISQSKSMTLKKQVEPPQLTPARQLLVGMFMILAGFTAASLAAAAFASFVADALAIP